MRMALHAQAARCCSSATSTAAASSPAWSATWSSSRPRSARWSPASSSTSSAATRVCSTPGIDYLQRAHRRADAGRRADARAAGAATRRTPWGSRTGRARAKPDAPLQIAVVRLPFISNYTDFDALADEPDVNVRYVTTPAELDGAAAIVLPGTKSTIADLAWLRESGLAAAVLAQAAAGTPVIGICGGYQMLGRRIHDPEHVESGPSPSTASACSTSRRPSPATSAPCASRASCSGPAPGRRCGASRRHRRHRSLGPPGTPLRGYEIHMGRTTLGSGAAPLLRLRGADGAAHDTTARPRADGGRLRQLRPRPLRPPGAARRLPQRAAGGAGLSPLPLPRASTARRRRRHRPPRRPRRGPPRRRTARAHRGARAPLTASARAPQEHSLVSTHGSTRRMRCGL